MPERDLNSRRKIAIRTVRYAADPRAAGYGDLRRIRDLLSPSDTTVTRVEPLPFTSATQVIETVRVPDSLGEVNLRMFDPLNKAQICSLVRHYAGAKHVDEFVRIVDPNVRERYERRKKIRVLYADPGQEEGYDVRRAAELETRRLELKANINLNVFALIQNEFDLDSLEAAADKFENARQTANKAIINHLHLVHPEYDSEKMKPSVKLRSRPADLLELALTTDDPILRFELQRQFALTVIALQQERGRDALADFKLTQVHTLLEDKLFRPSAEERDLKLYGEFREGTNELMGPLYEGKPTSTASETGHFKAIPVTVRPLKNGMLTINAIGEKGEGEGVSKAVRKTLEDVIDGKTIDDTIRTNEKVKDLHRMTIVVIGDESTRTALAEEIFTILTDDANQNYFYNTNVVGDVIEIDGRKTGGYTGKGKVREGSRSGFGQKPCGYMKIGIEFEGVPNPIQLEILVEDAESYFREKYTVGDYDPINDVVTGPAHGPYTRSRERILMGPYTPKIVYPELYGESQGRSTPVKDAATVLLNRNRI